jgi:trigger factor
MDEKEKNNNVQKEDKKQKKTGKTTTGETKKQDTVNEDALKLKEKDKALSKKKEVFIEEKDVQEKINEKAKTYKNKIKIKGFRPGKVPVEYIKRYLYKDLLEETIDDFLRDNVKKILDSVKNLATYPNITKKYDESKGLTIKIQYELLPEFELPEYNSVDVEDYKTTAVKKEVDAEIERLAMQVAEVIPFEKDSPLEDDDTLVDFEFQIKNPNTGKWMKKELLKDRKLKTQSFMDVNKHLKGMKIGEEKVFKGIIPDTLKEKSFAGKETEAKIKIISAKKHEIPELNDEFAKSLGEYKTLAELKSKVKKAIEDKKKEDKKFVLGERVLEKIADKLDFGIPVSFIFEEMNRLFKEGAQYDPATSLKVSRENIKKQLIMEKIAEKEKIDVIQKEVDEYIEKYAKSIGVPVQFIKPSLKKEQITEIKHAVKMNKVIALLGDKAKIKQKTATKSKTTDKTEEKQKKAITKETTNKTKKEKKVTTDKKKKKTAGGK